MKRLYKIGCEFSKKAFILFSIVFQVCNSSGLVDGDPINEDTQVIDTNYPLVIIENAYRNRDREFGASVALSSGPSEEDWGTDKDLVGTGWIFIGAPLTNSIDGIKATGALWRCSLGRDPTDFCEQINMDPEPSAKFKKLDTTSPQLEYEGQSWVGGEVEIKDGRLVTCGHRWTRGSHTFMNGICYFLPENKNSNRSYQTPTKALDPTHDQKDYSHRLFPFYVSSKEHKAESQFNFVNGTGVEWSLGQIGSSLHLIKNTKGGHELLLGAPGVRQWSGAVVRYSDNPTLSTNKTFRLNRNKADPTYSEFVVGYRGTQKHFGENHWYDYFGYKVSSGRYFKTDELLYSAGAPRANNLSGEVVIFTIDDSPQANQSHPAKRNINVMAEIHPPEESLGSYFGYFGSVLLSLDLNKDGKDELLVGSPLYSIIKSGQKRKRSPSDSETNILEAETEPTEGINDDNKPTWSGDHGCVFVYSFNESSPILIDTLFGGDNPTPGSRFGTAISYLRSSYFNDKSRTDLYIVIGAPYETEERGAIYIFKVNQSNGKSDLVQKISAQDIPATIPLYGFGFSISLPMDIDNNQTPDLAIGAYKSNSVVIFRTRPKIQLKGELKNIPKSITRENEFTFEACADFDNEIGKANTNLNLWMKIKLDYRLSFNQSETNKDENLKITHEDNIGVTITYQILSSYCPIIKTIINTTMYNMEDEDIDQDPIEIIQTIWYNETKGLSMYLVEYNVQNREKFDVNETSLQKPGLKNFKYTYPSPVSSWIKSEKIPLALNCKRPNNCQPEFYFNSTEWFHPNDTNFKFPLKEYTIGKFDLILRVMISNSGETGQKPKFNINWDMTDIVLINDNDLRTKDNCNYTFNSDAKHIYNCQFKKNIYNNKQVVRFFKFDMSRLYARAEMDNFTVHIDIYGANQDLKSDSKTIKTSLKVIIEDTKILLSGSRNPKETLENAFTYNCTQEASPGSSVEQLQLIDLYPKSRHTYRATIRGTQVKQVNMTFKLPWGLKSKLNSQTEPIVVIENLKYEKANIKCDKLPLGESNFYDINSLKAPVEGSSSTSESIVNVQSRRRRNIYPLQGEPENFNSTVPQEEDITSNSEISIDTKKYTMHSKQDKILSNDQLIHIHCNDEMDQFVCIELNCVAINVSNFVEIHFELYLIKDAVNKLLKEQNKKELLLESRGSAKIYYKDINNAHSNEDYMDKDVAQSKYNIQNAGKVPAWIYILAIGCGIFQLALIILILYKCGFFKRNAKQQLQNLKSEHARKSMMVPVSEMKECESSESLKELLELVSQSNSQSSPSSEIKKDSKGNVMEH